MARTEGTAAVVAAGAGTFKASLLMVLMELGQAVYIFLLRSLLASGGVSVTVLLAYVQVVSSVVLSSLALFLEKERRPPLSFRIGCWAFFLGFLNITLCRLMEMWSLRYITASFQTTLMNTIPPIVFLLAVAFGRERFSFCDSNSHAKLWGTLISVAGATAVVLSNGEEETTLAAGGRGGYLVGFLMMAVAVLSNSAFILLLGEVAAKFPADLSLSALMTISGTLQLVALAAVMERNPSAWAIHLKGSHQLLVILYGGIVVSGISYCVFIWCLHTKGPVFTTAFSPLLIVFSFFLEMLFSGSSAHLWSILGAVLVVGGLYLLLWAKAKEYYRIGAVQTGGLGAPPHASSNKEPLLLDEA